VNLTDISVEAALWLKVRSWTGCHIARKDDDDDDDDNILCVYCRCTK